MDTSGPIEAIMVALSFLFGALDVEDNPKAPSAATVLAHAPATSDYFTYVDVKAILPKALSEARKFRGHEAVQRNSAVRRGVEEAFTSIDGALELVKAQVDVDIVKDVHWVAAWIVANKAGDPSVLIAASGSLPKDLIGRIGKAIGMPVPERNGRPIIDTGDFAVAQLDDGTLIAGTSALVDARFAAVGKPGKASALTSRIRSHFDSKPFFVVASTPGADMRGAIAREIPKDARFLADVFAGHESLGLSFARKAVRWTWVDDEDGNLKTAESTSRGLVEILRAGQLAARGLARVVLAALHGYRDDAFISSLLASEDTLLKLVVDNTGDGSFDARIDVTQKTRTLDVKLTADSFKRIVPLGAFLPLAAVGFAMFAENRSDAPERAISTPTEERNSPLEQATPPTK